MILFAFSHYNKRFEKYSNSKIHSIRISKDVRRLNLYRLSNKKIMVLCTCKEHKTTIHIRTKIEKCFLQYWPSQTSMKCAEDFRREFEECFIFLALNQCFLSLWQDHILHFHALHSLSLSLSL